MPKAGHYKIIALFLLARVLAVSQNLVPNGDFEIYSQCPNSTSSYPANMQINYANGWQAAALTPDYYNACAGMGNSVFVPYSNRGYQMDCCGGGGYIGIYTLDKNTSNNDGREYVYTKLIDTLEAGHKYLMSMSVNRANYDYSMASLGMLLTDTVTALVWPQSYISAVPQVLNTAIVSDTANWILVQDTITANGNELYLTIGNFNTSATSDSVKSFGSWWYYGAAYYFIDNVGVVDVSNIGISEYNNEKEVMNILPNPNDGNFVLQYNFKKSTFFEITDVNGILVGKYDLYAASNKLEINNSNLEAGIYLYRIVGSSLVLKTGKLVIMK
jgi:hypothetical protein